MHRPRTAIVCTGGDPVLPTVRDVLPDDAFVVAADSGIEQALALGLTVDLAVGDFDSVAPATLEAVEAAGTRVDRHPVAKDATDLELALDAAVDGGAERVVIVGGYGGRLDHFLANALLIASPRLAGVTVEAIVGYGRIFVTRGECRLTGRPGELVTLLPVGGAALGVTTEGLLYPLSDEDLPLGTTRGVSNEMVAAEARVRLREGTLVVVQPGELGTHHLSATTAGSAS